MLNSLSSNSSANNPFDSSDEHNPNDTTIISFPNSQIKPQLNAMVDNLVMGLPQAQLLQILALNKLARGRISKLNRKKKREYYERNREWGANQLWVDYFAPSLERTYSDEHFRRRFRMKRELFLRIVHRLKSHDTWFEQKPDATGRLGMTALQKCTAAIRVLAYGASYDQVDEYMRMAATTVKSCLNHFICGVIDVFGTEYLRAPNPEDLRRLLHVAEERHFPGMIGSIDCMHWEWKNCPMEWKGQFTGRDGKSSIILEAVASYDLWIWHAFFGVPGSCNDINVLDRSPLFNDILEGRAPPVHFEVNGHQYNLGYYLTDGIYPPWATFVKAFRIPHGDKEKLFSQLQESYRKDVERAFGVLQARFAIIRNPAHIIDMQFVKKVMRACIILHNMIVEDERATYRLYYDPSQFEAPRSEESWHYNAGRRAELNDYLYARFRVRNKETNNQLQEDLMEHIWQKFKAVNQQNGS